MNTTSLKIPVSRASSVKCAAQHFGAWAVEPKWFARAMSAIRSGAMQPAAAWDDEDESDSDYQIVNGIAVISIDGQMTKRGSSFGGCSTVATRQAVRSAATDISVRAIMLRICSPGGTVAGTADLAADVAAAGKVKPVNAYIEDIGCSAAYWVASQCATISANVTALVGSLGTYMLLEDDTSLQDQVGVKYRVVSSAEYKELGSDGQISDKLISEVQREVNELNAPFLAAVASERGKRLADVSSVSDGRVHVGGQAVAMGLIDQISSFDVAMQSLAAGPAGGAMASGREAGSQAVARMLRARGIASSTPVKSMAEVMRDINQKLQIKPAAPPAPDKSTAALIADGKREGQEFIERERKRRQRMGRE